MKMLIKYEFFFSFPKIRFLRWACTVKTLFLSFTIDHFTVVFLVTWPLNGNQAEGDLVLIQTLLLLLCKSSCSYANYLAFT